jgi:hypothetical protein
MRTHFGVGVIAAWGLVAVMAWVVYNHPEALLVLGFGLAFSFVLWVICKIADWLS